MKTAFLLMAQYERAAVPLAEICKEYFGLSPAEAARRASMHQLAIPTFRLSDSQKSPLMVHVDDLALHIDETRAAARRLWENSQI
ncbi:pyocin activator PrtN family protein [Chromobacterium violaceum]|uniref:pyocin activator PrtN family protein n=1 Tax=Chromobacterium violaceum TaxID=536 RepID=UPI001CE11E37|nr:pyocin activator PrtN family protein [Chromobacterium violaceum]